MVGTQAKNKPYATDFTATINVIIDWVQVNY